MSVKKTTTLFLLTIISLFVVREGYALELSETSLQVNCSGGSDVNVNTGCVITDPDGLKYGLGSTNKYVEDFEGDYNVTNDGGGEIFFNLTKSGIYTITIYAKSPSVGEAKAYQNNYFEELRGYGFTDDKSPLQFTFVYRSGEAVTDIKKTVTVESFLNDLSLVKELGLVLNSAVYESISARIKRVITGNDGDITSLAKAYQNKLNSIIKELQGQSGKAFKGYGAAVLIYDISALLGSK